eukprot:CAMPEP_0170207006 /NCGR_PEP_ID=MMETSP0116_2-20130129/3073_1 /TAXON_ID=400756 /ORGANISM="Durinskia baltica, Strain CSIRO CS-38" /LENGTH=114 /DNA_ID=CAMNT_0010457449 /DNA_START=1894 /DNA_END=2238 /DNA_ORIENTATION=-
MPSAKSRNISKKLQFHMMVHSMTTSPSQGSPDVFNSPKDAKIIETKMLVFGTKDDKCAIRALSQSPKVSHCLELRSQQSMLVPLDDNYMTLPSRHTGFEASYPSRRNKAKYKYL